MTSPHRAALGAALLLLLAGAPAAALPGQAAARTQAAAHPRAAAHDSSAPGSTSADAPGAPCTESVPFRARTEGYRGFRIPAVVEADGGLLAFAEGRRDSLADDGDIDVVVRRSEDGGCTWGPLRVVADAGRDTIGNPSPVVDPATGRVVLLTCRNEHGVMAHRRVFVQHGDATGSGFTPPREITAQVKPDNWNWYGTGPGHALALRHGPHPGRLLVPANHSHRPSPGAGFEAGAHSLYSDDGGLSWQLGYVAQQSGSGLRLDENSTAELPDGRVYSNVRLQKGSSSATRADAFLAPGGTRLPAPYRARPELAGPVVQASTLWVDPYLVFAGPADPDARAALTLRVSDDRGTAWRTGPRLTSGPSAYSDLVRVDEDTLGVLYEKGTRSPYETLTFTRVPMSALAAPASAEAGANEKHRQGTPSRHAGSGNSR